MKKLAVKNYRDEIIKVFDLQDRKDADDLARSVAGRVEEINESAEDAQDSSTRLTQ